MHANANINSLLSIHIKVFTSWSLDTYQYRKINLLFVLFGAGLDMVSLKESQKQMTQVRSTMPH